MLSADQNALSLGMLVARKRSQRMILMLLSTGFLAVVALFALVFSISSPGDKPNETPENASANTIVVPMATVLMPAVMIQAGQKFERAMFKPMIRPLSEIRSNMITDFIKIDGYYAHHAIAADRAILVEDTTPVRPVGVSSSIPSGFRAITITVNTLSSVEGWVRPGAHVDVAWIAPLRGQPSLTVILENIPVLSVERQTQQTQAANQNGQPPPGTITLLVKEEEAQKLVLATTTGSLSLALRGDLDQKSIGEARTVTVADLLGGLRPQNLQKRSTAKVTYSDPAVGSKKALEMDGSGHFTAG